MISLLLNYSKNTSLYRMTIGIVLKVNDYTELGSNALLVTSLPLLLLFFGNDRYFFLSVTVTLTSLHFYSNGNEFNRYFYRYFNSVILDSIPLVIEKSIPITKQFTSILENYIHAWCFSLYS